MLVQLLQHFLFQVVSVHAVLKMVVRAQGLLDLLEQRLQKGHRGLAIVHIPRPIVQPEDVTAVGQKGTDRIVAGTLR